VREQLDAYIRTLTEDLAAKPEDDSTKVLDVAELEEKVYDSSHHSTSVPSTNAHASRSVQYQIHDKPLFASSVAVLSIVVLFFFLHSWIEEYVELSLAWIAIMGAMVHLVVSGIREIDRVLEKVEFSTLIFFAALFVLMHGLEQLGVMDFIGGQVAIMIVQVQAGKARLTVAILLIIWVSAIVSAFIDNIPYTTAMIPIVTSLSETYVCDAGCVSVTSPSRRYHLVYSLSLSLSLICLWMSLHVMRHRAGLPLGPLLWALTYGTCLGGNGTLIGASANVVACGLAEAQGYPISFNYFIRIGFPIMLLSVLTCTIYLLITHVLIPWY